MAAILGPGIALASLGSISSPILNSKMATTQIMSMSKWFLFIACKRGDIAAVRKAVANEVDVRKVVDESYHNFTPLHYACKYVTCEVIKIIMYNSA